MRIACVHIPHFHATVALRRQPHLRGRPAVIADHAQGTPLVVDATPAAAGVVAGMPLAAALSRCPDATVLEADAPACRRLFQQLCWALQGVGDRVEAAEPGTAYVGLDGLAALHGGEPALLRALREAVPGDLEPRIGLAAGTFPAGVAARSAAGAEPVTVPDDVAAFLAPHSIDLLPCSRACRDGLHRFGLHTLGAVAALRPAPLLDRFGQEGRRAWELSRGIDPRPLVPLTTPETVVERLVLPFAATTRAGLLAGVEICLQRAFAQPALRGRSARRAELTGRLQGAPPWAKTVHFRAGVGRWEAAAPILRRQLTADHPAAPIEAIVLALAGLGEEAGEQLSLFPAVQAEREHRLTEAERQLQARYGSPALYRLVPVAPWHPAPERRVLQAPIDPAGGDAGPAAGPAGPRGGPGGPGRRPPGRAPGAGVATGRPHRGTLAGRPLVAAGAPAAHLLPRQRRRRPSVHPLPGPARGSLVPASGLNPVMAADYVELHARSFYAFGEGASHPHELLAQAQAHGSAALALTDPNCCGALEFARLANSCGIQPITGGELPLTDGARLVLLATTREGYANLTRLFTLANAADRRDPRLDPARLPDHAAGLICLTGGRDGPLARLAGAGRYGEVQALLGRYREWFGPDALYVELQRTFLQGDHARNHALVELARAVDIPLVATNDVRYHVPERARLQQALAAARRNTTLDQALPVLHPNAHCWLKPPAAMAQLFHDFPDAIANTVRIAAQCRFNLGTDLGYTLPQPPVPAGQTPESYLRRLCEEAAVRRDGRLTAPVQERLAAEFRLIERHNLAGFLLLYREIVRLARGLLAERGSIDADTPLEERPPGRGRGSSVALLVGYLIGISHVDPLHWNLTLERFLPEDMTTLPDIDLDFPAPSAAP